MAVTSRLLLATLLFLEGAQASVTAPMYPHMLQIRNGINSVSDNCGSYSVQSSDTCFSIASTENVTWAQLIAWNSDLENTCGNLQDLTSICISNPSGTYSMPTNTAGGSAVATSAAAVPSPTTAGSTANCGQWYLVSEGENCSDLTEDFSISLTDILCLNTQVWTNCTNLLYGFYYCVEPVGSITDYAACSTATTTAPFDQTSATSLPYTDLLANYTSTDDIIPLANGTRTDCYEYIWFDNITDNAAADCWNLATVYAITSEEIVNWNPSLDKTTATTGNSVGATITASATTNAYKYPCTLSESSSYCVQLFSTTATSSATSTPTPQAAGVVANCTAWYQVQSFSTCASILSVFYLDIAQFYAWNPSVGDDCTGLAVGTYYCISTYPNGVPPDVDDDDTTTTGGATATATGTTISTPSPVQTGIATNCDKFYEVKTNDTCYDISMTYGISLDEFYAWNPAVDECADLETGTYVCVDVSSSSTATTTGTSTATGITTPSPIQTGMVTNCDKFYDVKANDTCYDISLDNGISLDTFYSWNPAVNGCADLETGVYVCIGIESSTTATATATVATTTGAITTTSLPSPVQPGIASNCDDYYFVQPNDGCYAISVTYGISLDNFYAWNPAVGACTDLEAKTWVCIGVSS
ncbi:hypothetical protein BX600DRAFT_525233 [Xylariales sp. PMI_506]|nr:hypothetical protein BX600DRAFT_525233 [Xylariales sp. PMI_506]